MSGYYVSLIKIIGFFNADVEKNISIHRWKTIENMILMQYKVKNKQLKY